jgi:hypothetical protein
MILLSSTTISLKSDRARDKCAHCLAVADALCAQAASAKSSNATSDFAKYLTLAMEMFFTLIDDADVDVRILADEQLNRLMRALGETYFGRLQVNALQNEVY